MTQVKVSRQVIDADNRLNWEVITIPEEELLDGEVPYVEVLPTI